MNVEPHEFPGYCDVCERFGPVPIADALIFIGAHNALLEYTCPACDHFVGWICSVDSVAVRWLLKRGVAMQTSAFDGVVTA